MRGNQPKLPFDENNGEKTHTSDGVDNEHFRHTHARQFWTPKVGQRTEVTLLTVHLSLTPTTRICTSTVSRAGASSMESVLMVCV